MSNFIKAKLPFILLISVFALLLGYLNWPQQTSVKQRPKGAIKVITQQVELQPFRDVIEALGTSKANESVSLFAEYSARVKAIYFNDGEQVKKGQRLLTLHSEEEEAEVRELQANLTEAQTQLQRFKNLHKTNAAAQSVLDEQQAKVASIQAQLEKAKAQLARYEINAPFDGLLGLRQVSVGAFLSTNDLITTLDDIQQIKVDFTVPERELSKLALGQKIEAATAAFPNQLFTGTITSIAPRLDPVTRSVSVRAVLANQNYQLKPGMLINVVLERSVEQVLLLDERALIPQAEQHWVYLVKDGVAHKQLVTVGRRKAGIVEVLTGLAVGDEVVIEGGLKLRDKAEVQVLDSQTNKQG